MSTDLMQRLADYRDDLDAAIEQHRAAMLVEPIETPRPAGRVVLAAAVVALVAGGIGLVVAVNRDGPSHQPVSGIDDTTGVTTPSSNFNTVPVPSTTIVSDTTWDWLDQFGAEVRQPPVPDGRNVLDFEAFRFAMPADWIVPSALTRSLPAPGFVLIAATEPTMCASVTRLRRQSSAFSPHRMPAPQVLPQRSERCRQLRSRQSASDARRCICSTSPTSSA